MKLQTANHRYPIIKISLCPYRSTHLPAGRMNVPTVGKYAAGSHERTLVSVTPKEDPMTGSGVMDCARLTYARSWEEEMMPTKAISRRSVKRGGETAEGTRDRVRVALLEAARSGAVVMVEGGLEGTLSRPCWWFLSCLHVARNGRGGDFSDYVTGRQKGLVELLH
jgi:hypothetical protein